MVWGFRKSVKVLPGVRITMSKRGPSVSGGPKGAKVSLNSRGKRRGSLGFLGMFWRRRI